MQLNDKEYRDLPYESYSSLKYLLTSVQEFKDNKAEPFEGSDSTLFGECVHHYLQGNKHLVVFNEFRNVIKNRELIERFKQEKRQEFGPEVLFVPQSFKKRLDLVEENASRHPFLQRLLKGAVFEVPVLVNLWDLTVKGRVDGINAEHEAILEIKTSSGATTKALFARELRDRDYDFQSFIYNRGVCENYFLPKLYIFIVVNSIAPCPISVYVHPISQPIGFLAEGAEKAKFIVDRYKRFIRDGYEEDPSPLGSDGYI